MDFLLVTSGIFLAHKTTKKRKGVKKKKERKQKAGETRRGEGKKEEKMKGKEKETKPRTCFLGKLLE